MQISGSSYAYFPTATSGAPGFAAPAPQPVQNERSADPVDRVEISDAALLSSASPVQSTQTITTVSETSTCEDCASGTCTKCGDEKKLNAAEETELSEEEQAQVKELKERDDEVRAHEAAHAATGGSFAGSPSYEYQTGPDGKRYAIGGEVKIDASPIDGDPQATIQKLRQVRAAALAPAEPSGQDQKVAQAAAANIRQAESELAAQRAEELQAKTGQTDSVEASGSTPQLTPSSNADQPSDSSGDASVSAKGTSASDARDADREQRDQVALQQIQKAVGAYERIAAFG